MVGESNNCFVFEVPAKVDISNMNAVSKLSTQELSALTIFPLGYLQTGRMGLSAMKN